MHAGRHASCSCGQLTVPTRGEPGRISSATAWPASGARAACSRRRQGSRSTGWRFRAAAPATSGSATRAGVRASTSARFAATRCTTRSMRSRTWSRCRWAHSRTRHSRRPGIGLRGTNAFLGPHARGHRTLRLRQRGRAGVAPADCRQVVIGSSAGRGRHVLPVSRSIADRQSQAGEFDGQSTVRDERSGACQ